MKKLSTHFAIVGAFIAILFLQAKPANAQFPTVGTLTAQPSCATLGTRVTVTGSGWRTIFEECEYQMFFDINGDGVLTSNEKVAQQGPDVGLEEQPNMSFDVPSATVPGERIIEVRLVESIPQRTRASNRTKITVLIVKRSDDPWFLCGQRLQGLPTEITVTAEGATKGTFLWEVIEGQDKVNFENNADTITTTRNNVQLKSTAKSISQGDVTVRLTFNRVPCAENIFEVRAPFKLVRRPELDKDEGVGHSCNSKGNLGWRSLVGYEIFNQFEEPIKKVEFSEKFGAKTDIEPNNWIVPKEGGDVTTSGFFVDTMCFPFNTKFSPLPMPPQSPLTTRVTDRIVQQFFVGNRRPGTGCHVQTNDFVRFIDHGRHENIKSPPTP